MRKLTFFLLTALFAVMTAPAANAQVKYVAVVEVEIDARSGASADLSAAEVGQITAELRREAVKNLPRSKYNIMTSETVQAQGGAVLEECADENCVITLGSKIGADYIVRGIISKFRTMLTLMVEMYETENGTLVASSDPVRYENVIELLEKAASASADMYKTFAASTPEPQKPQAVAAADPVVQQPTAAAPKKTKPEPKPKPVKPKPEPKPKPKPEPKEKTPANFSVALGGGVLYTGDFCGGIQWGSGEILAMPYHGAGAYLFLDAHYAAISVGYHQGGGTWTASDAIQPNDLPYMSRQYISASVLAKYPNLIKTSLNIANAERNINIYPIAGIDYDYPLFGKLDFNGNKPEYVFDGSNRDGYQENALSETWLKIGCGLDFYLTQKALIRVELMYGVRQSNWFETDQAEKDGSGGWGRLGQGVTFRAGAGFKL